jgi:hypothetical protein
VSERAIEFFPFWILMPPLNARWSATRPWRPIWIPRLARGQMSDLAYKFITILEPHLLRFNDASSI